MQVDHIQIQATDEETEEQFKLAIINLSSFYNATVVGSYEGRIYTKRAGFEIYSYAVVK